MHGAQRHTEQQRQQQLQNDDSRHTYNTNPHTRMHMGIHAFTATPAHLGDARTRRRQGRPLAGRDALQELDLAVDLALDVLRRQGARARPARRRLLGCFQVVGERGAVGRRTARGPGEERGVLLSTQLGGAAARLPHQPPGTHLFALASACATAAGALVALGTALPLLNLRYLEEESLGSRPAGQQRGAKGSRRTN